MRLFSKLYSHLSQYYFPVVASLASLISVIILTQFQQLETNFIQTLELIVKMKYLSKKLVIFMGGYGMESRLTLVERRLRRVARFLNGVARMRSVWREFQVVSREGGAYGANSKWRRANAGRMARIPSGVARMRGVWREFWVASRDWEAYGANFPIKKKLPPISNSFFIIYRPRRCW